MQPGISAHLPPFLAAPEGEMPVRIMLTPDCRSCRVCPPIAHVLLITCIPTATTHCIPLSIFARVGVSSTQAAASAWVTCGWHGFPVNNWLAGGGEKGGQAGQALHGIKPAWRRKPVEYSL